MANFSSKFNIGDTVSFIMGVEHEGVVRSITFFHDNITYTVDTGGPIQYFKIPEKELS